MEFANPLGLSTALATCGSWEDPNRPLQLARIRELGSRRRRSIGLRSPEKLAGGTAVVVDVRHRGLAVVQPIQRLPHVIDVPESVGTASGSP